VAHALHCAAQMSNLGDATALNPLLLLDLDGGALGDVACNDPFNSGCPAASQLPGSWHVGALPPAGAVTIAFDLTLPADFAADTSAVSAGAYSYGGEIDDGPDDNSSTLTLPVSLFADGFETPSN
jgi:hypothetical protein